MAIRNNWYKISQLSVKKPWEMSEDEFVDYHRTGWIPSDAYKSYEQPEGISWLKKEKFPVLRSSQEFNGKQIEFRQSGKSIDYVKKDENDEILRNEYGKAVYLSEEEKLAKNLPLIDTTIVAFDGDVAIGFASDEWGADGVWVTAPYQKMGIGVYLLKEFRNQFSIDRRIGQMTDAGENMTRAYHRTLVKEHNT